MICGFCGKDITNMSGYKSDSHTVHHKNDNHHDIRPENELDCHFGCHTKHHLLKRLRLNGVSPKLREAWRVIGLANKDKKWTMKRRKKRSKDYTGRPGYRLGLKWSRKTRERYEATITKRRERERISSLKIDDVL